MRRHLLVLLVLLAACPEQKKEKPSARSGPATEIVDDGALDRELAPRPLGLAELAEFGFESGAAAPEMKRAEDARKAKNWAAVQTACSEALAKDPAHLGAHRLLASALVQEGKPELAGEHLSAALAGDFLRYAPDLDKDPDLAPYVASARGARLTKLIDAYRADFLAKRQGALLLAARRSSPKPGPKPGVQSVPMRGEVYAYSPESARFLQITHTRGSLAGFLVAPSGEELAYVTYSRVKIPDPAAPGPAAPVEIVEARVGRMSLLQPEIKVKESRFINLRTMILEYRTGDELWVATTAAAAESTVSLDVSGETRPVQGPLGVGPQLRVAWMEAALVLPNPEGVEADWRPDRTAASFRLPATGRTIDLPPGEVAAAGSFAWSPSRARLVFSTSADLCSAVPAARQSSLYLVEAATGRLKHLRRAEGVRPARFVNEDVIAFEDDKGAVRLVDAARPGELATLATKSLVSLVGMGNPPRCTTVAAPPAAAPTGNEPPMPPEETPVD